MIQDTSEDLIIFLNSEQEMNACINNQEKIDAYFESDINDLNRER